MGIGLWLAAIAAVATVFAAGTGFGQLRLEVVKRRERLLSVPSPASGEPQVTGAGGLPVTPPTGQLPRVMRGRDELLGELRRQVLRRKGGVWVLAGMGGVGKSAAALATAKFAAEKGWRVWWVDAANSASMTGCLVEILHQVSAPRPVIESVRSGAATAAERTWDYLNSSGSARRALIVFDSADDPAVLAAGSERPAAGTGWLRPDRSRALVLVTTRHLDHQTWGQTVAYREIKPLPDAAAAAVLADLDPLMADPSGTEALELGRRLGGLPLALHLAGTYLRSPFAEMPSFAAFRAALDGSAGATARHDPGDEFRSALQQTWSLSLDALADGGRPQSRQLLYLLCCYSPATPVPLALFHAESLKTLLGGKDGVPAAGTADDLPGRLRAGWKALSEVGLIDVIGRPADEGGPAVAVHLLVADVNRALMLTLPASDLRLTSRAAVDLLAARAGGLDFRLPADWPAWRQLAPHAAALLGWLARRLDQESLIGLLDVSDATARALLRGGNIVAAGNLIRSEMDAAGPLGSEHPSYLAARCTEATMLRWQGRYADAEALYREVLLVQLRVLGGSDPDTLRTRHNIALGMADQGEFADAEKTHREVLADRLPVLGHDHPDTLDTRLKLAQVIARQDRFDEAEALYRDLITDQRRALGSDHPDTLGSRHGLAEVIAAQQRYADAEHRLRQVLADRQRVLGGNHPDTLESRNSLADVITAQGRHGEAVDLYLRLVADRQRVQGHDHPDTVRSSQSLASLTGSQTGGRFVSALRALLPRLRPVPAAARRPRSGR